MVRARTSRKGPHTAWIDPTEARTDGRANNGPKSKERTCGLCGRAFPVARTDKKLGMETRKCWAAMPPHRGCPNGGYADQLARVNGKLYIEKQDGSYYNEGGHPIDYSGDPHNGLAVIAYMDRKRN